MPPIPYLQGVPRNQNLGFEQLNSLYSLAYGDDYNPQYLQDAVDAAGESTLGAQYRLFNPDMSSISVTTDRLQYIQDLYDRFAKGQKVEKAPVEEGRYRLYNFSDYDPNTGEVSVNKNNPAEFDQNRLDKDGVIFNKVSWGLDKLSRGFNYITPSNYVGSAIQVANGDIPLSDYLDNVAKGNQGIFESEAIKKYAEEHPWVNASLHAGQTVLDLYGQGKGINLFLNTANKIGKGVNTAIDTAKQAVGGFSKGVKRAAMRNILKQEVAAGNMTEEEAIIYARQNNIPLDEEFLAQRSVTKQLPQQVSAEVSPYAGDPSLKKSITDFFGNYTTTYPRLPEYAEQENEIAKITEDYYEKVLKPLFIKQGVTPRENLYTRTNMRPQFAYDLVPDDPKVQGLHTPFSGYNLIKVDTPLDPVSVGIHEAASHGTEDMITLAIDEAYQKGVGTLDHTLFKIKGSKSDMEYRATLQEVRKALEAEYTLPDGSIDLQRIRDVPDQRILDIMKAVNGYGQDYVKVYNQSSPSVQKAFMDQTRKLLMEYPAKRRRRKSNFAKSNETQEEQLNNEVAEYWDWFRNNRNPNIGESVWSEFNKPIRLVKRDQLPKNASGTHNLVTGENKVSATTDRPDLVATHEVVGHGSQSKLTPEDWDPYERLSSFISNHTSQNISEEELRAETITLVEAARKEGIDINKLTDQQLLDFVETNAGYNLEFVGYRPLTNDILAKLDELAIDGKEGTAEFDNLEKILYNMDKQHDLYQDELGDLMYNLPAPKDSPNTAPYTGSTHDGMNLLRWILNYGKVIVPGIVGAEAVRRSYLNGGKLIPRKYSKGGAYTRPETEQNMLHRSKVESRDQELKDRNSVQKAANDAIAIVSDLYEKLQNKHSTVIVSDLMDVSGDVFSNLFKNNPTLKYGISTLMRTPGIFEAVGAVCNMIHTKTVTFDQIRDVLAIVPGKVGMIISALNLFIDLGLATAEQVNKAKATTLWVDQLNKAIDKENMQVQFNQDGSYNATEVKVPPVEDLSDKGISYILTKFPKMPETDEEVNAYLTKFQ